MQNPSNSSVLPLMTAESLRDAACLVGRLLLAYLFVIEGYGKITGYADVQAYMAQFGVSPTLLPLVILTELGGGLLIALGLFTRPAAVALGGFCVLAALIFHRGGGDEAIGMEKDFAIAGGFLVLAAHGAGPWALDGWLGASLPAFLRPLTK
jgi:putative oxidoreductase